MCSRDLPTGVRVGEVLVWGLKTLKGLKNSHICYYRDVITGVDVDVTSQTSSFTLETGHQVHPIFFKDGHFTPTGRYAPPTYPTATTRRLRSRSI